MLFSYCVVGVGGGGCRFCALSTGKKAELPVYPGNVTRFKVCNHCTMVKEALPQ